jgi:hypothetical protein
MDKSDKWSGVEGDVLERAIPGSFETDRALDASERGIRVADFDAGLIEGHSIKSMITDVSMLSQFTNP